MGSGGLGGVVSGLAGRDEARSDVGWVHEGCEQSARCGWALVLVGETVTKECHPGRACRCDCPEHTAHRAREYSSMTGLVALSSRPAVITRSSCPRFVGCSWFLGLIGLGSEFQK